MKNEILIANNLIDINSFSMPNQMTRMVDPVKKSDELALGTILSNLAAYGYMPSLEVVEALNSLSTSQMTTWWKETEPALKEITGANRNMDNFVVYKNFPKEVLDMTHATYWIKQIYMYWGTDNAYLTEPKQERSELLEKLKLKVLHYASLEALDTIYANLVSNTARWSDAQTKYAKYLTTELKVQELDLDSFPFKENGIVLIQHTMDKKLPLNIYNATDVLRLAAALSDGDVSLREKVKFRKFSRPERKFFLNLLEESKNLMEDVAIRPEIWKKFFFTLHPNEYKFEKVKSAAQALYKGSYTTFNSEVENKLAQKDESVLELLKSRPGEFFRRFHNTYKVFDKKAVEGFTAVLPKLTTLQLLKLDNYLLTIRERKQLIYAPNGNWTKAQFVANKKVELKNEDLHILHAALSAEIGDRVDHAFPHGIDLDMNVDKIKLQTNDQKLANYGRGTVFDIPEKMNFIRTASYWENKSAGNTWFDNGWNFFNENWQAQGTCNWSNTHDMNDNAVFSGDPTNSKDLNGRACQMIDLYIDKLLDSGVRYAVWNILSYNGIKFSDAGEVLATLQWGEEAQSGNLYEPARAQMVFPIEGENLTKYIAYIDLKERKLVYMDANLYGNVHSAASNAELMAQRMPAYVEYLKSLPSVADLFIHAKAGSTPVYYSDEKKSFDKDIAAYVIKPMNAENQYKPIDLDKILDSEAVTVQKKTLRR